MIQKEQKERDELERMSEQERRRQEAIRERLAKANKKKRPAVPGLHNGENEEDSGDEEEAEEDGREEEVHDEEIEQVGENEVSVDAVDVNEEQWEPMDWMDNANGGGGHEEHAADENEDAGSDEAEGSEGAEDSEAGEASEDGEGTEGDDEEEDEDEDEDDDDDDDSDDDALYTFVENPVRWKRKRTSTYHKRLEGKVRPPKLKRLGAEFLKLEDFIQESIQAADTGIPVTAMEEAHPWNTHQEMPSTSYEDRPSTSREERPGTSHADRATMSHANNAEAESEPDMDRINVDEPFKPTVNYDPTIPFWMQFSYSKKYRERVRLKRESETQPEPIIIRNAYTISDNSSLGVDNTVKEQNSSEIIANMTNEDFERHLARQEQENIPPPRRRLFGQTTSAHEHAPLLDENAWQLAEALHQSLQEYKIRTYLQGQQNPSTSKAADDADIGLLRLAQMAVERNKKPENQQEHIDTVAQQDSLETRELVSPDEYMIDLNMYTGMLLNTVARKCEDMKHHGNNWTRYGNIDPHMQKFLDSLPERPPAVHQSASSAPINIHGVVQSLSSVTIDENNAPTPDAFLYRSSMSQISIEASASKCNIVHESVSRCNEVDESPPKKQKRKRKSKKESTIDANQPSAKRSKNGNSTKRQATANQPVSLFLNPTTDNKPAPEAQPATTGEFVFGNWSAIINMSETNDNQSAIIQFNSSACRLPTGVTKKRKRSQVEGPDNTDEKSGKDSSPPAGPSRKRRRHKEEKGERSDSEEGQLRRSSRKRKREEESSSNGDDERAVKKRR